MVRPSGEFLKVAEQYVCVRVVDLREVDLNVYRFDFDLTLAALLMNADGTVYHRYGGRQWQDPAAWMSSESLVSVMRATLAEHAAYGLNPSPPAQQRKRTIGDIPPFRRKLEQQDVDCVHCHMVNEAERAWAQELKRWERSDMWVWPDPDRVGLVLDAADQARVERSLEGSAAWKAGVRSGDVIESLGTQSIRTIHDIQWVLDGTPAGGGSLPLSYLRGDERAEVVLLLADGWKVTTPLAYSWRAFKWGLDPQPGFGGKLLTPGQKAGLGLDPDAFALEVGYLVTWGENAYSGRNAARAGLRKGDVILSIAGQSEFASEQQVQSWFRIMCQPGDQLPIRLLRGGRRLELTLTVAASPG